MALELNEFLLTGKLGPVHCGIHIRDILQQFGEPTYKKDLYNVDGSIREIRLVYNALGMCFEDDRIAQYGLYLDEGADIPQFLNPVGYFPLGGHVPMEDFLNYLKAEQIPFRGRSQNEDDMFSIFTKGEVAVGGRKTVGSLIVPCPGTECWRSVKEREQFRIHPPKPFPKR